MTRIISPLRTGLSNNTGNWQTEGQLQKMKTTFKYPWWVSGYIFCEANAFISYTSETATWWVSVTTSHWRLSVGLPFTFLSGIFLSDSLCVPLHFCSLEQSKTVICCLTTLFLFTFYCQSLDCNIEGYYQGIMSHYVCRAKTTNELRNRYQGRS